MSSANTYRIQTLLKGLLAIFAVLTVYACGGGSGGNAPGDDATGVCGGHGTMVDGLCVCDEGYTSTGDGGCVPQGGGDEDLPEADKTDEDADADKDDGVIVDGDMTDNADKTDEPRCTCPSVTGHFCIDESLPNEPGYTHIKLAGETGEEGCALGVQIYKGLENVFTGELSCDAVGAMNVETLGCKLSYNETAGLVYLACGEALFSFSESFCEPVSDGDEDETEEDTTDGDGSDAPTACEADEDCPAYFFCSPATNECVEGYCNEEIPCEPGMICTEHGTCKIDPEATPCSAESAETDCPVGFYCDVQYGYCAQDCVTDEDCPNTGENCVGGRCMTGYCDDDADCPVCFLCDELQHTCIDGCCTNEQCPYMHECDGHRCNPIGGDEDSQEEEERIACTENTDCPPAHYCNSYEFCDWDCRSNADCHEDYFCNEWGLCEYSVCVEDTDCPSGNYCFNGYCQHDCVVDVDCGFDHFYCTDFGRCDERPSDIDIDYVVCTSDSQCDDGWMCDTDLGRCVEGECEIDDDCEPRQGMSHYCTRYGRCEYESLPDVDEYEIQEVITCVSNEDCPQDWRCQLAGGTGVCVNPCTACAEWQVCVDGACVDCTADMDCEMYEMEFEETDFDIDQPCVIDGDCPRMYFCNEHGKCETECLPQCPEGSFCDLTVNRCVVNEMIDTEDPDSCISDVNCDPGCYCDVDFRCNCELACESEEDCPRFFECSLNLNQCIPLQTDCTGDGDCPRGTHCVFTGDMDRYACNKACYEYEGLACTEGSVCSPRGLCVDEGHTEEYIFPECSADEHCPTFSYCAGDGVCQQDCTPPGDIGCPDGLTCNEMGKCVEPSGDTDGDLDDVEETDIEDAEPEEEEQPGPTSTCLVDADCPFHSYCAAHPDAPDSLVCTADCMGDHQCEAGQVCSNRGRCVETMPDWSPSEHPYCVVRADCDDFTYCWQEMNICRIDCVYDPNIGSNGGPFPCDEGLYCNLIGQCTSEPVDGDEDLAEPDVEEDADDTDIDPDPDTADPNTIVCSVDADCPYHTFCNNGVCDAVCMNDAGCTGGQVCNHLGRCAESAGTGEHPSCVEDSDCHRVSHCSFGVCRMDCLKIEQDPNPIFPCPEGQTCSERGRCLE